MRSVRSTVRFLVVENRFPDSAIPDSGFPIISAIPGEFAIPGRFCRTIWQRGAVTRLGQSLFITQFALRFFYYATCVPLFRAESSILVLGSGLF